MQGGGFDIKLNGSGKEQAELVSAELAGLPLAIIASSHLKRAQQTADICRERHPTAKRLELPEFREMRFGEFEGLAIQGSEATEETKARSQLFQDLMLNDSDARCPGGGESIAEVESRG